MKSSYRDSNLGKSTIHFLPMIDMKATDYSCIYSTMLFVQKLGRIYSKDIVLTFDQPLYWKAMEIKTHESKNGNFKDMVLILGAFHSCMSFYGSIGHLMAGSGLQSILELIYAEHTVPHMLSGKAFARATRGHLIIMGVLSALLLMKTNNIELEAEVENDDFLVTFQRFMQNDPFSSTLSKLFNDVFEEKTSYDDVLLQEYMIDLAKKLKEFKENYYDNKTTRLWLMYIDMVSIACKLTEADRSGNWMLHREALREMLPYFAASGHYLYAKSTYLYLQTMHELEHSNPKVYEMFLNGFHVVHRTEFNWSGLPPDLVIEQELMHFLKSTGGMTHGRGMDELHRAKFILSTPLCSQIKCALELLTGIKYLTKRTA